MDDPGQLAILEAIVQGFETGNFLYDLFGNVLAPVWAYHFNLVRKEPKHPAQSGG